MDLQTALLSAGVCLISAAVVYLISVFGMKEKTYEEAIEEQRKRNQEAAQQNKVEKPKKERKFKKQSKRSKESRNSEEESEQTASNHVNDHVDFKTETEIIPQEPDLESKPPKAKKKFKAAPKSILLNKQDVGPISSEIPETHDDDVENDASDSPPPFVPKDELERRHSMDIGQKKLAALIQNSQMDSTEPEVKVVLEEVNPQPEVKVEKKPEEVAKKSKKQLRSESFENAEGELSFKKLLAAFKKVTLVDEEIQSLIDILLNKQQGGTQWTKKNDPVALLKKQLVERETALEAEQRLSQTANGKLKEVRLELTQEKTRSANVERSLRQELQTAHARLQAAVDLQAKNLQVQTKASEEQVLTVARLSEEKVSLQQQVQLLEVERQKRTAHERDLQRELEDRYQSGLVQEQERMSLQLQSKEAQLQQLLATQQEGDFQCSQAITELKQQLQEVKSQRASLSQELEGERSTARLRLEEKDMLLRKQEEDLQRIKRMAEEERLKLQSHAEQLQGQVKNSTNQLQDTDRQLLLLREEGDFLRQQLASEQQERHSLQGSQAAHQLQERAQMSQRLSEKEEALRKSLSELASANQELDSQKAKNNELRERNWKAMDALSSLEKSSKEKEEALTKEVTQAREEAQTQQQQNLVSRVSEDHIQRLKEDHRCYLQRILPDSEVDSALDHSAWLEQFSEIIKNRMSSVSDLRSENASLGTQVVHYQTVLSDTESMLKKLQSGVEAQEGKWTERLAAQEDQTKKVLEEKRTLEEQLQQLQGIEEATAEMQGRLKELQSKLQGEESDRKGLEAKTDEVASSDHALEQVLARCSALSTDLDIRTQESERQRQEGEEALARIQAQLDTVQKDLDKERKITKELGSQAVKLNSLVKIGQDALRAEQELVKQLQAQTTTTPNNGNNNNNNNKIPAANGTAVENESAAAVVVRTDKPNKSKKRGASSKK